MVTNTLKAACLITLLLAIVLPAAAQRSSEPRPPAAHGPIRMEPPIVCCGGKPIPEHPMPLPNGGHEVPITPVPPAQKPTLVPISPNTGNPVPITAGAGVKGSTDTSGNVKTDAVQDPLPTKVTRTDNDKQNAAKPDSGDDKTRVEPERATNDPK